MQANNEPGSSTEFMPQWQVIAVKGGEERIAAGDAGMDAYVYTS